MDSKTSFLSGFNFGRSAHGQDLTPREIAAHAPEADGDAFAQGMIDGLEGDRWRADRILSDAGPLFSGV